MKSQPNFVYGILLSSIGCMMLVSGRLSITPSLEKISLIPGLLGLVLLIGGGGYLRLLYVPIFFLFFAISAFDVILSGQLIYFQRIAAYIAANVLDLLGLPVSRSGQTIALPHITLEVVSACSGINHILALVGIAFPLAFISQKTRYWKIILVCEAFFIGILANGLRIAAIGLWTHFTKSADIHGPEDIFLASFIFGFGLVALLILSVLQGRLSFKGVTGKPGEGELTRRKKPNGRIRPALTAAALLLLVTGGYLFLFKTEPLYLKRDLREFPTKIGSWTAADIYRGSVKAKGIRPDSELKRTYRNSSQGGIHVYVAYFAKQNRENKVINSEYSSFNANSKPIQLVKESNVVLSLNHKKNERGEIYFAYVIDGKLVSNPYIAKLAMAKNAFIKRRGSAGVLIIETDPVPSMKGAKRDNEENFIGEIVPLILSNLEGRHEGRQGGAAFPLPES